MVFISIICLLGLGTLLVTGSMKCPELIFFPGLMAYWAGVHVETSVCRVVSGLWVSSALQILGCSPGQIMLLCSLYLWVSMHAPHLLLFPDERSPSAQGSQVLAVNQWVPFLSNLGLQEYANKFEEEKFEMADVAEMSQREVADFNAMCDDMGMKGGEKLKLKCALHKLLDQADPSPNGEPPQQVIPAEETRLYDPRYANRVDNLLYRHKKDLVTVIQDLYVASGKEVDPNLRQRLAEIKSNWLSALVQQQDLIPHEELEDLMLALHLNTLEEDFPFYKVWRQANQWTPHRAVKAGCKTFSAAMGFMTWVDQALAQIPPMEPTKAYRTVKNWKYSDLLERFWVGRSDVMWYEPKSVAWNSPGSCEGEQLARSWAEEGGDCTVFIIENFNGPNISWLSEYPDEHEAMTRALQKFEVVAVVEGDRSSGDSWMRSDRVTLRQLPMQRREPLVCHELNHDELGKYLAHEENMRAVELYSQKYEFKFKQKTEVTAQQLEQLVANDTDLDGLTDLPCGKQGVSIMQNENLDMDRDAVSYGYTLLMYNRDVNGLYDYLVCVASQKAQRESAAVDRRIAMEVAQLESSVREEASSSGFGWLLRMIIGQVRFDRWADVQGQSQRRALAGVEQQCDREKIIAFQEVLAGFILKKALDTNRLAFDKASPNKLRLLPPER